MCDGICLSGEPLLMQSKNAFTLYLIRHGQSEVNATPDMIGQGATTPLTKLGMDQAAALRDHLDSKRIVFDKVFSSDYTRALETAKIVSERQQYPIHIRSALREYSAGDWAFQSRKEVITPEIQLKMGYLTSSFLPPNGESLHQVERRASKWLEDDILYNQPAIEFSAAIKRPAKIAVFSHGMTIKCLLHYIMGFDQSFTWKIDLENTSVTTVSFGEVGWKLNGVNDTSHLSL
jgi:broad specificity phosphatase PhoE